MAKQKASKSTESSVPSGPKLQEEIRGLAERIFKERGNGKGDAMSDWLEAEKRVKQKYGL